MVQQKCSCLYPIYSFLASSPDTIRKTDQPGRKLSIDGVAVPPRPGPVPLSPAAAIKERSTSLSTEGSAEPQMERAQTLMRTVKRATDRAEQLLRNAT